MASALLQLRKKYGFKNHMIAAKEFDINPSTYARYELSPEKIPTSAAWKLADYFQVPIDIIVGRQSLNELEDYNETVKKINELPLEYKMLFNFVKFMSEQPQNHEVCF